MELLDALNWRYATKRMTGQAVATAHVEQIIEAARLAPTSAGLQPFNIVVITDPATKAALAPIALNQPQITQCSHLLVFVAWDRMDDARIEARDAFGRGIRNQPVDVTMDVVNNLKTLFAGFTQEQQHHHAAKQAHIGMGLAIAAAALLKVDATPMEGFDKEGLDAFLGLAAQGLKSVTLMALGHRDTANDWLYPLQKVRIPTDEFVIHYP